MPAFNIDNFLATVNSIGLSRKNRFEVLIDPPAVTLRGFDNFDGRGLSLLAESIAIPELTISAEVQQIWGPAIHRPKGINYGGFMTVQFYVDQDLRVKKIFDNWMQYIVDGNQYTVRYQSDYVAPLMTVAQLDDENTEVYRVRFEEAFPAGMTQLDLNHGLQNSFHLLQVNFRYRRWYREI